MKRPTEIARHFSLSPALGLACLLAALAVPASADGDWTSFRGDPQLSGRAASELPAKLAPLWSFQADDAFEATAAIAGNRVYAASLDGRLYALDLADGKLLWSYETGEEIKSSPLVVGERVYFGDEYGRLHAVDAASGKKIWVFEAEGAPSARGC